MINQVKVVFYKGGIFLEVRIALSGFGKVGKQFVSILKEKKDKIYKKYHLDLKLVTVLGNKCGIHVPEGINLDVLLDAGEGSPALMKTGIASEKLGGSRGLDATNAHVLVEATPTNIVDAQPALSHILAAIEKKMNVVSLTKGPLVIAFDEIIQKCQENSVNLKYSGATAAALPTIDIGNYSLVGCEIKEISGVLNGTTNYVLTKMTEEEVSYEVALEEAIRVGIAEKNHQLDTGGFDTACKVLILANSLMGCTKTLKDVRIEGIEKVSLDRIREAKKKNCIIKLIGNAKKVGSDVVIEVQPKEVKHEDILAKVRLKDKAVVFDTDLMGKIAAIGGGSDPRAAAAAALKDVINIFR